MAPTNQAAWLNKASEKLQVGPSNVGKPGPGEVLIHNHAVAINPVDWMMQDNLYPPKSFPAIMGNDIAGEVVEVGKDTPGFFEGQRVLAHALGLHTGKPEHGGFQNFTVASVAGVCPIPNDLSYEEASVLPLALSTAAIGLFRKDILGLPKPSHEVEESGKALLVWGGSSSVGSAVIQLATAAGLRVITTASKKNFDYCREVGASQVFDHSSPSIVGDLTAAFQKYRVAGAYDAISTRDTQLNSAQVLAQLGGGNLAVVLPPIDEAPATVNLKMVMADSILADASDVAKLLYRDFLPNALESGQVRPAPKPKNVGHGLDYIQTAIDKLRKGVSASKMVVAI